MKPVSPEYVAVNRLSQVSHGVISVPEFTNGLTMVFLDYIFHVCYFIVGLQTEHEVSTTGQGKTIDACINGIDWLVLCLLMSKKKDPAQQSD